MQSKIFPVYLLKYRGAHSGAPALTVVRVAHCGVLGEAGVKVGHEGGNVLRGSQHSMSNIAHEDEPWGQKYRHMQYVKKKG